jgi:hypothetical protein
MEYNIRQHTQGYAMAANILKLTERAQATHQAFVGAIIDESTRQMLKYCHLTKMTKYKAIWNTSFANELGHLAQGIQDIKGTDTIHFIPHTNMLADKTATYGHIVCTHRPQKEEQNCTRLTVGGNRIH